MIRRATLAGLLASAVLLLGPLAVPTAAADVELAARLDDRVVADVDANRPLALTPSKGLRVAYDVTNHRSEPLLVRSVRLDGRVLGMTFFVYSTQVDLTVAPGATESSAFDIDLQDLGEQATGLLPARLSLLGPDRQGLARSTFPVDVRGRAGSAYGVFGMVVAVAAALLLGGALLRLALGQLPGHRWARAVRFATPGVALGLTATFALSAWRVLVPDPDTWLLFVVLGGLLGLVAGFLTPSPEPQHLGRSRPPAPDTSAPRPEQQPAAPAPAWIDVDAAPQHDPERDTTTLPAPQPEQVRP